jgi:hypothetical protein
LREVKVGEDTLSLSFKDLILAVYVSVSLQRGKKGLGEERTPP